MLTPVPGVAHTPPATEKWLEVQIAWSRLHEGSWSPMALSAEFARFNNMTTDDAKLMVLMDMREQNSENFIVISRPATSDPKRSEIAAWFRAAPEQGVFSLQPLEDTTTTIDGVEFTQKGIDMSLYRRAVPHGAKDGGQVGEGANPMTYLGKTAIPLYLPGNRDEWCGDSKILAPSPTDFALAPFYPTRRPERHATFPTLFFADENRSFVVDPVEKQGRISMWSDWPTQSNIELASGSAVDHQLAGTSDDRQALLPSAWADAVVPAASDAAPGSMVLGRFTARDMTARAGSTYAQRPSIAPATPATISLGFQRLWRFRTNHHPHVGLFVKHLNAYGLDGLLDPRPDPTALDNTERQFLRRQGAHLATLDDWTFRGDFASGGYSPTALVVSHDAETRNAYPLDDIDFSEGGTYSLYNWELFFHIPLLLAVHLSRNQRFDEARQWFHAIFDPTDTPEEDEETPQRYWRLKPFYNAEIGEGHSLDRLLRLFSSETNAEAKSAIYDDVAAQIRSWLDNPFNPWSVARLRGSAYQRTVVLKYIDNLVAWGDSLFRQYNLESVDQARLLYVLASELLGPRPETVEVQSPEPQSFENLLDSGRLDLFSNALVELSAELDPTPGSAWDDLPPVISPSLYFCVPPDEKLLAQWDRVEDRLYKIRHCLDIDGSARPLALFDPPIDPGAMIRAVAGGGGGLASALATLNAPLPAFRYSVMVARAKELCGEVRNFGSALLSALEKRDGEALARLRSTHELALLDAVSEVRQLQIDEAKKAVEVVEASKALAEHRRDHFNDLVEGGWSDLEKVQIGLMTFAITRRFMSAGNRALASILANIPQFVAGAQGVASSPVVTAESGGKQASEVLKIHADVLNSAAMIADSIASTTGLAAAHGRREENWTFQRDLADKEVASIDRQIESAKLRLEAAEREFTNHALQRDNAAEVSTFLQTKITGVDLYDWMVGQLANVYVQAYQLALDLARRAERAWQFEVAAATPPAFVQASHWDSLRKGLLAGERLAMDLHRLDIAYLEQSQREYEITRHFSLAQVAPDALMELRATGSCEFALPELLFDVDRPGLYHRRIRAVRLSLPCVAGPLAPVHATLRLLDSYVRTSPALVGDQYGVPAPSDARFTWLPGPAQGIITSRGTEDSGLFEQHLRDERYLPFEGHGAAASRWRIELPEGCRAFDYETLSDAVLHLRYTAREGGEPLRDAAASAIVSTIESPADTTLSRVFALRTDDPAEWNALVSGEHSMVVDVSQERFPYALRNDGTITPTGAQLWMFMPSASVGDPTNAVIIQSNPQGIDQPSTSCQRHPEASSVIVASVGGEEATLSLGDWRIDLNLAHQNAGTLWNAGIRDAFLVVQYNVVDQGEVAQP